MNMLISTGLKLEWSELNEQIIEGHVLGGGLTTIYTQNEFGRSVICLVAKPIKFFNKICQKVIIYSLPRCLKKPLVSFCISNCELSQSDLDYLPYCLNIFELKCLYIINIHLQYLCLEPLGFLLESVRHTLGCLALKSCNMGEPHFKSLLPALSQCFHLTDVNFQENELSLLFLKQLLQHTSKLTQLSYELYPAPLECYDDRGLILSHRLEQFCPELLDILRAKRQPKDIAFVTNPCSKCGRYYVYDPKTQRFSLEDTTL